MTTYILRRLFLMIPTLLGITFLVFMLIALSPGGIGAAIRQAGGQAEATSRALQEAYLEDRYGLDDPAVMQYLRWLSRISPIKFGARDQVDARGDVISYPKPVKLPPLAGQWYAIGSVPAAPARREAPEPGAAPEAKERAYRLASNTYARARAGFIAARTELERALRDYSLARGLRAVEPDQDLILGRFERAGFDASAPEYAAVAREGQRTIEAYARALEARESLAAEFRAKPFDEVGFWLIPGSVSIGPPDFGKSFSKGQPVVDLLLRALPVTLLLNLLAFPIIYMVAIPTGILAATRQGSWFDVASGALFVALWSVPVVWAGTLAVGYLASEDYLGWFPPTGLSDLDADRMRFFPAENEAGVFERGYLLDRVWHLCLPVACLVYAGFAVLSKQTRAAMLDNFNADYVRTAKAKGVPARSIVFRHVFRNSLLPVITIFASVFPAMLSGSVVVESIFNVPGMGRLIIESINLRDREVLLANTLMVAVVNLLALLMADILYALADPRISYD